MNDMDEFEVADEFDDNSSTVLDEVFEHVYGDAATVKEAAFQTRDGYMEIHVASDGSWDYTIYDTNFDELDGGQVGDASTLDIRRGAEEGCRFSDIDAGFLTAIDLDLFEDLQLTLEEHR